MERRRTMWVSHNKVLVGSGDGLKKPHARNPNFDSEETKLLIQLWGDPQVQRTLITIHKKHPVIAKIAEKMRAYGYNRSTEEINTRIKNLKCLYNRIKKDLESGLLNEPSWKHYNAMDEILSRPVFGNSNKVMSNSKIIISHMPSSTNSSPTMGDSSGSMLQVKEEDMSEDDEDMDNESMDYEASELRPEDLLNVIEDDDKQKVQIKEEPGDVVNVIEQTVSCDKSKTDATDADSSTDSGKTPNPELPNPSPLGATATSNPLMTKNIINYANDSLSIASVVSGTSSTVSPPKVSVTQTASKISLVPTKLLLKPQTSNSFKPGSTIVYTSQQSATNVGTITTNAQSSSSIPMKVVFVNALNSSQGGTQTGQKTQITINKSLAQLQSQTANSIIANKLLSNTQNHHKVQLLSSSSFNSVPRVTTTVNNNLSNNNSSSSSTDNGKSKNLLGNKLPVIRNLLTNIVEIENQRLDIERQRFEYEKSVGNELLAMMRTFLGNQKPEQNGTSKQPQSD